MKIEICLKKKEERKTKINMKFCYLAIFGLILVASKSFVDGKPKNSAIANTNTNKFEGDFEFVDEVSTRFDFFSFCMNDCYVRRK